MMSGTKKVLLVLLAVFILIQFIRPDKNQSGGTSPADIFAHYPATDTLRQLIQTSCYDCHSDNTTYPWYAEVQPVAWWLNDHIKDGKKHLNFSQFATYTTKKAAEKMEEVAEEVKEKEMPLQSYTFIHRKANLSNEQRDAIVKWANNIRQQITANPL